MLKILLALGWHAWDAQDAWRHDPRPARRLGAFVGLAWSVSMAAAALWSQTKPPLVEVRR